MENRKISVYPKKYQWLRQQKENWMRKAYDYFYNIANKHNYEELLEDYKDKCMESHEFFIKWILNQPSITYYPENKRDYFCFMHKPLDFGIEALKIVIDRYWEILKA